MTQYVIRYEEDGAFNYGKPGTPTNGFPVQLEEASLYASVDEAEEKARDLRHPDGTGVQILTLEEARKLPRPH